MPEKQPADFIGCCFHIENNAHAFLFTAPGLLQLQDDGGGKIVVSFVFSLVVFPDIDHAAQVFQQASVRIVRCRFVEKTPAVGIRIQDDLHGVDDRRFAASGMAGKKVDAFVQRQYFMINVMPVVQCDSGNRLEGLAAGLSQLLCLCTWHLCTRHLCTRHLCIRRLCIRHLHHRCLCIRRPDL